MSVLAPEELAVASGVDCDPDVFDESPDDPTLESGTPEVLCPLDRSPRFAHAAHVTMLHARTPMARIREAQAYAIARTMWDRPASMFQGLRGTGDTTAEWRPAARKPNVPASCAGESARARTDDSSSAHSRRLACR